MTWIPTIKQMQHLVCVGRVRRPRASAAEPGLTESAIGSSIGRIERGVGKPVRVPRRAVGATLSPTGSLLAESGLDDGSLDLAVMMATGWVTPFPYRVVTQLPIALAVARRAPDRGPVSVASLADKPFVLPESASGREIARTVFSNLGWSPPHTRATHTVADALSSIAAGVGYGLFPDTRSLRATAGERVEPILEPSAASVQIVVASAAGHSMPPEVSAIRDLVRTRQESPR